MYTCTIRTNKYIFVSVSGTNNCSREGFKDNILHYGSLLTTDALKYLFKALFVFRRQNFSMTYWQNQGAPAGKLNLGLAVYGRTFHLSSPDHQVGAPASGPAAAGVYTKEPGFLSYYEICTFLQQTTVQWIADQHVPYATKGDEWVGYDNKNSVGHKVVTR
ncbi:Oviduct-specific glycoprotein [Merluccius polli]|uniref:Oviduct-specific glycoprotein n=1 Tax=Merluccius polli TaxID=89951 RepID=A0AA47N5A3_MERPO|nr:Oviduct-specific glycoprotein [Merluccius polli]